LFTLVDETEREDSFIYIVTRKIFSIYIIVNGVDTTAATEVLYIVDFVYFFWQNMERFSFKKHAFPAIEEDDKDRLLCLQQYRAASDCLKYSDDCDNCVEFYQDNLRPFTMCQQSVVAAAAAPCAFPICARQAPSIRDITLHAIHSIGFDRFELTVHTTYDDYRLAALSRHSEKLGNMLPPEFHKIPNRCRFESFDRKVQRDYPVEGLWSTEGLEHGYASAFEAIVDLFIKRNSFCDKGLFCPIHCLEHGPNAAFDDDDADHTIDIDQLFEVLFQHIYATFLFLCFQ
jgi:hypothetical protein